MNKSYKGESIEKKINRIVNNKEPIKDGSPKIYTERKNGVEAQYDIRTDRFEYAVDAMDKVDKSNKAKRMASIEAREKAKVVDISKKDEGKTGDAGIDSGTK